MVVKFGANTSNNCCESRFFLSSPAEEILLVPQWMTIPGMWDFSCLREHANRGEYFTRENAVIPNQKNKKPFRPNVWKRKPSRRSRRNNRRSGGALKISGKDSSTDSMVIHNNTSKSGKLQTASFTDRKLKNTDAFSTKTRRLLYDDSVEISAHVQVENKCNRELFLSEILPSLELSAQTSAEENEGEYKLIGLNCSIGLSGGFTSNFNNNHVMYANRSGDTQAISNMLIDQLIWGITKSNDHVKSIR